MHVVQRMCYARQLSAHCSHMRLCPSPFHFPYPTLKMLIEEEMEMHLSRTSALNLQGLVTGPSFHPNSRLRSFVIKENCYGPSGYIFIGAIMDRNWVKSDLDGLAKLEEHLRIHGIDKTYTCWTRHGEKKGEHCSSNLNSNDPFIHREDNNVMVDSDSSNYSGDRGDISNVMNEELHDHPDMSERLKDDAQWLSSSSLVFYIRYLSEVFLSKNPDLAAKFSFVSPHLVSHLVDSSDKNLAKCLLGHIDKDHLLLLPYNVS
ncbi:hypothetical protein POM88_025271 [Heracleum sosnowskyi]|uniref:Uncharacterized protein n=1 Tax=Heracleum sosnowskyi TaxID=360622 RepID=A0AAD8MMS4_9APIA|nr:hypothetical protein POM88_025271 [Heracleum sosnowskyi]